MRCIPHHGNHARQAATQSHSGREVPPDAWLPLRYLPRWHAARAASRISASWSCLNVLCLQCGKSHRYTRLDLTVGQIQSAMCQQNGNRGFSNWPDSNDFPVACMAHSDIMIWSSPPDPNEPPIPVGGFLFASHTTPQFETTYSRNITGSQIWSFSFSTNSASSAACAMTATHTGQIESNDPSNRRQCRYSTIAFCPLM